MIVPVVLTVIILFPFLLYIIFPSTDLIPISIEMHTLPEDEEPADADMHGPSLPNPITSNNRRPSLAVQQPSPEPKVELDAEAAERAALPLKDIIDPFLDKAGALFGGVLITITLVTLLATNAAGLEVKVFEITLPAAFIMFCRDIVYDWRHRNDEDRLEARTKSEDGLSSDARNAEETNKQSIMMDELAGHRNDHERSTPGRTIATGQPEKDTDDHSTEQNDKDDGAERARPALRSATLERLAIPPDVHHRHPSTSKSLASGQSNALFSYSSEENNSFFPPTTGMNHPCPRSVPSFKALPNDTTTMPASPCSGIIAPRPDQPLSASLSRLQPEHTVTELPPPPSKAVATGSAPPAKTRKVSVLKPYILWNNTTRFALDMFPTVCAVFSHLPFPLLPFAFSMFILVQGLVTKGWVALLSKGWAAWIDKTGVVGAVGGMGFAAVCMCNVSFGPHVVTLIGTDFAVYL